MCLITTQKEPKIAEKDMMVYKTLLSNQSSIFNCFMYSLGILYKTEIKESNEWCCFDDYDMDFLNENFKGWNEQRSNKNPDPNYPLKCFGPGFHSAKTRKRLATAINHNEYMFSCIIPAGSEYYEDATDLIVSNQIIIVKKIK